MPISHETFLDMFAQAKAERVAIQMIEANPHGFFRRKRTKEERSFAFAARIAKIKDCKSLPAGFDQTGAGNCGIVALSIACKVDYQEMFKFVKNSSGRSGKWTGSTLPVDYYRTLKHYGIEFKHTDYGRSRHGLTVKEFAKLYAKSGVTYMVAVRGHILTIRSGHYIDQRGIMRIENVDSGANARINQVWEIL